MQNLQSNFKEALGPLWFFGGGEGLVSSEKHDINAYPL